MLLWTQKGTSFLPCSLLSRADLPAETPVCLHIMPGGCVIPNLPPTSVQARGPQHSLPRKAEWLKGKAGFSLGTCDFTNSCY